MNPSYLLMQLEVLFANSFYQLNQKYRILKYFRIYIIELIFITSRLFRIFIKEVILIFLINLNFPI